MTDKIIENNQVEIMGKIASRFTFSHQVFGEGFYMVDVLVKRLSDSEDRIPVMISERLVDVNEDYEGEYIHVMGQFRSYNRHEEKKNRLVLSVFAREVEFVEDDDENMKSNAIFLDGYICKPPVYRKTPLGREIADLLIAVNRQKGVGMKYYAKSKKKGFANSVAAPAVEYQKEGQVFGIGSKIFTIAGPVILYGVLTSWVVGLIQYVAERG